MPFEPLDPLDDLRKQALGQPESQAQCREHII